MMRNLTVLAKWLAGQADVDVESYTGSTACIYVRDDGRKIIKMPDHWVCATDPEAVTLIEGVIDHEALGHGRFTDFNAKGLAVSKGLIPGWDGLSSGIFNILEDVYIERAAINVYPGVKQNLAETVKILMARGFFGSSEGFSRAEPARLLMAGLLNLLRAHLIPGQGDVFSENVTTLEKLLPDTFGEIWNKVYGIALEVEYSTSTDDNIFLTARIMSELTSAGEDQPKTEARKAEGAQSSQGADSESESEQGEGADSESGQGKGAESEQGESAETESGQGKGAESEQGESAETESGQGKGDESEQGESAGSESGQGKGAESEQGESAETESGQGKGDESEQGESAGSESGQGKGDESEQGESAGSESGQGKGAESEQGEGADSESGQGKGAESEQGEGADSESGQGEGAESSGASRALAKAILASRCDDFETELGDAISSAIGEVITPDVFARDIHSVPLYGEASGTAMLKVASRMRSISDDLIDALETETKNSICNAFVGKRLQSRVLSRTKLGDSKVFRKKEVAQGLSTAVSILVDVSGSMNDGLDCGTNRLSAAMGLVIGLGDILDEYELPFEVGAYSSGFKQVKDFNDSWSGIRRANEYPAAGGDTYSGAAMMGAISSLMQREEDRKVLLIITDGDTSDLPVLVSCYAEAREMDIDVASLMIGPVIPSIQTLAQHFGFTAKSCNHESELARYAIERILSAI